MNPAHPWTAAAISTFLHVAAFAVFAPAARNLTPASYPRVSHPLTFMRVVAAPDPAIVAPIRPFRRPPAPRTPEPTPVREVVPMPIAVARVAEPVRRVDPVRPTPAAPTPVAHAIEPPAPVQMAGFDAPIAHAAPIEMKRATVGAFDTAAAGARPQPGSDRANVVAEAGFGAATASAAARPATRQVAEAGFGAAAPSEAAVRRDAPVTITDFDRGDAPRAATAPAARPVRRVETPVEIVSKPTPAYTDEARALKIEGDVVLDVEFTAAGDVHVLRVTHGLGHGLDEAAMRAALAIRFKPALSDGRPVDFRSTVHIVFRLAEEE